MAYKDGSMCSVLELTGLLKMDYQAVLIEW